MPSTDRLSNIARARVSAVVLDEASGRERAATEVFNKVDADGEMGRHSASPRRARALELVSRRARSSVSPSPPKRPPARRRSSKPTKPT
jgi:hypothetical protein